MAKGDITEFLPRQFGGGGAKYYKVGVSATLINPGEPVTKALAGTNVSPMASNKPVVATDYLAGVATTTSTNTASAVGSVYVQPLDPNMVYLIAPKVAATWNTQAAYDALVGSRVLLDLTAGTYTILASDSTTYGCVVEPLDITKYPNKVAFSFREGTNYLA